MITKQKGEQKQETEHGLISAVCWPVYFRTCTGDLVPVLKPVYMDKIYKFFLAYQVYNPFSPTLTFTTLYRLHSSNTALLRFLRHARKPVASSPFSRWLTLPWNILSQFCETASQSSLTSQLNISSRKLALINLFAPPRAFKLLAPRSP